MLLYLSGPVTADTREKELVNLQKFHDLEKELVARGFEVFNPVEVEFAHLLSLRIINSL